MINDEKLTSGLFDSYKPLSTFGGKTEMAYCLGLISETEYRNLETIRTIRNNFAHKLGDISFMNQSIKDKCANLEIPEGMYVPSKIPLPIEGKVVPLDLTPPGPDSPAELFKAIVLYLMANLGWRWVEARKRRCEKAKDLSSAADRMRMMLAEFDRLEEELESLSVKRAELKQEFGKTQEVNETTEESGAVALFKKSRPLIEYTIKLMDHSYAQREKYVRLRGRPLHLQF